MNTKEQNTSKTNFNFKFVLILILLLGFISNYSGYGQAISNTGSIPVTCFGDCDGVIWFTITGGTAPYFIEYQSVDNPTVFDTFLVAGADTTEGLCASQNNYTIIVTDAGGGAAGAGQGLGGPGVIAYLNLGIDTVTCVDTCDGTISGFGIGGNGNNYSFLWSNTQTDEDLSNLCAMMYYVTMTDDSGCVGTDSVPIINRDTLQGVITTNNATCKSLNDGNISINMSGGVQPYTYAWTSNNSGIPLGSTTDSIFNLLADTFTLILTDGNNCPYFDTSMISEPTGLDIDTIISDVDCFGNNNGEIHLTVSGGIPGYIYNWSPAVGTDTAATNLIAGVYNVTITDNNGVGLCPENLSLTVNEPDSIEITFTNIDVNCFGGSTGIAVAITIGGTQPYNYSWSHNNGLNSDTAINLNAGPYTVSITDDMGCPQNDAIVIDENDSLEVQLSTLPISCFGANDGIVNTNPQGGVGNYFYLWSSSETTQNIGSKGPATYVVTLTDDSACIRIDSILLVEPAAIQPNLNITNVSCFNNLNGTVTASPQGGTRPFIYTWVNVSTLTTLVAFTDSFATNLDTGNYTLTIQDQGGCIITTPFSITQPDSILANVTNTDLSCAGDANGFALSSPVGGSPGGYTFVWSSNVLVDTNALVTGLIAGTYTVTVSDQTGCTGTETIDIDEPDSIKVSFTTNNASCGLCDGDATINVIGGVLPYVSLNWSNGDVGTFADLLCPQFYAITITDDSNCVKIDSIEIISPGTMVLNPSQTNNKCSSDNSGIASVAPTGGLGIYVFLWNTGATTSSITGLDTGVYTVTVMDAQPCIISQQFTILSSSEVLVSIVQDSASCTNTQDGGATANVAGGTSPFDYLWSNTQTNASATGLGVGTHFVTVTDDSGCFKIDSLTIQPKVTIVSGITIVTQDCNNSDCDGTAQALASGGATPYSFTWSSGFLVYSTFDSSQVDSVCGGQLIVIAQDADGCEGTDTIIMPVAASVLQFADSAVEITCNGEDDGKYYGLISGGGPPYTYSWSNGETGTFIDSLSPGIYSFTATDTNNCAVDTSHVFIEPLVLVATGTGTNVVCNGNNDGTATASVTGGTSPYTYLWPASALSQTNVTATGLNVGTYEATITDARGCTDTAVVVISEPNGMQAVGSSNLTTCFGDNDGTATITVSGGSPQYNYQWDINTLNQTTLTATGLSVGTYLVTVRDTNNCILIDSVQVNEPMEFVGVATVSNLLCSNDSNGIVVVVVTGGTPNYNYIWDATANSQTTATATGLAPGVYGLTVTDSRGCDSATTVTVTGPQILLTNLSDYDITCGNGGDGAAAIHPQGGLSPYSINWSTSSSLDSISSLSQGVYYVTLTDSNNCVVVDSAIIDEPLPLAAVVNINASNCNMNDGSAIVGPVTGGTPGYTHSWSTGATTSFISGLAGGVIYTDTISDSRGCTIVVNAAVSELGGPQGGTVLSSNTTCSDSCNGSASVVGVFGGVPPYSYSWSPGGQTDTSISGLCADTIILSVTDDSSCTSFFPPLIISSPDSIDPGLIISATTCDAVNNGAIATNTIGGTAPYSYLWSTAETTTSIGNLAGGTYNITILDVNRCQHSSAVSVSESSGLAIIATNGSSSCANSLDGFIGLNVSNGVSPYNFVWDGNAGSQTTATATGLAIGTYNVTITDDVGCFKDTSFIVGGPLAINVSPTVQNAACGVTDGQISIVASGGTGGYTYLWAPTGETTAIISGLSAGLDTVRVSDNSGCFDDFVIAIQNSTAPSIVSFGVNPTCATNTDGFAWTIASGGTAPYSYLWTPGGQTTDTIPGLSIGTYYIQVQDDSGCVAIDTVILNTSTGTGITFSKNDVLCPGNGDGSALVNPVGGLLPYQYNWSNSKTSQLNNGLSGGTFIVTVTDDNNCILIDSIMINEPNAISVSFIRTNIDCYGQKTGTATASASGGTGSYSYNWDSGNQSPIAGSLDSGYHVVTVTDVNSCTAIDSVLILSTDSISNQSALTHTTCNNAAGAITVITSGGSGPYDYLWSPTASTSASITQLSAGVYTLTTTDGVGCSKVEFYVVNNSNGPTVTIIDDTTTCFLGSDASLIANVSGGTLPYLYLWNDLAQQTTVSATGLSFGVYQVAVTDSTNCVAVQVATVEQPAEIITSATIIDADCGTIGDVTATVSTTGGATPYDYLWPAPGNQTTATVTGLSSGTFVVTISDFDGCSSTETIIIDESTDLSLQINGTNENCAGSFDAIATTFVTGGVAPYTYFWSNTETTNALINLSAGTFILTLTDTEGCSKIDSITVNSPNPITTSTLVQNLQCFGDINGSATVSVGGGTLPYTYNWSPTGSTSQTAINLMADTHIVQIIDFRGCSATDTAIITEPSMIEGVITTTEPGCQDSTGIIVITPFGGSGIGYTYLWDDINSQTDSTATGLSAGTYSVDVTDSSSCTNTFSITLNNAGAQTVSISTTGESCLGAIDGTATAIVIGGTTPYTYSWSNGDTGTLADSLPGGVISVTVIDSMGCIVIATDTIDAGTNLNVTYSINQVSCSGTNDGSIAVNVSGGFPPYLYNWAPIVNTTDSVGALSAGTYFITISDTSGCDYLDSIDILNPSPFTLGVTLKDLDCYNDGSGEITISILNGGNAPFTYDWSNASTVVDSFQTGLDSGTYIVTVTDASNCIEDTIINLTQPDEIIPNFVSTDPNCNVNDGNITANVSGGVGSLTYQWGGLATGQTTQTATALVANIYPLTITDSTGCVDIDSVALNNINAPTIVTDSIIEVTCSGFTNGGIFITTSGPDTPFTYLWVPTNDTFEDLINVSSGSYSVFVTDTSGCIAIEIYNINEPDSFQISFASTQPSCNGVCDGQIIANVVGGTTPYTYSWSPSSQTDSVDTALCAGMISVIVMDSNNCTLQDSILLIEPPGINISLDSLSKPLCVNSGDGQIAISASGGVGNLSYSWTGPNVFTAISQDIIALDGGQYSLIVTDSSGCQMNLDTLLGTQVQVQIDSVTTSDSLICSGDTVTLKGYASGASGLTFDWSLASSTISSLQTTIQSPAVGTNYFVFTAALGPCLIDDSVLVETLPTPIIDAGDDFELLEGLCADLGGTPSVPAGVSFSWSPSTDLSSVTETNPETCTEVPLTYILSAIDGNGCKSIDSIRVEITPEISFLEGFSPNGDGNRDTWVIGNLEDFPDVVVKIFNRWGQKLFESSPGYLDPWDGSYNGKGLPIGTYFYIIELNHPNFPEPINGPVTILK